MDRAQVQEGATVLVHAGAGGVGPRGSTTRARAFGAQTFATASAAKSTVVEGYGATPIDYRARRSSNTRERGRPVALGSTSPGATRLAEPHWTPRSSPSSVTRATCVSCVGWGTHALAPLSFRAATYSGVFTLLPLAQRPVPRARHGQILTEAAALADAGKLRPLLNTRTFTIDDLEAAYMPRYASPAFGRSGRSPRDYLHAAIDDELTAHCEGCFVRCQEHDRLSDLRRVSEAAGRHLTS